MQPIDSAVKRRVTAAAISFTPAASEFLERLAAQLDVPPSRYEEAEKRYLSVGEWLDRDDSSLRAFSPNVYVQGSFRLGTPIRPIADSEDYDIDLVCELDMDKSVVTQRQLKDMLGRELQHYAAAHGMQEVRPGRRSWRLDYAEGAQFHLDALPAIPDGAGKRLLLESRGLSTGWVKSAIAITDIEHPGYDGLAHSWPHSNPRGYTEWFRSRMREAFQARRSRLALEAKASVEAIPSYKVKTPLQQAVQILKRHRDLMFVDNADDKPISIILTTLAGWAYQNESTVAAALKAILQNMGAFTRYDLSGNAIITNPTDPSENFADKWADHPERRTAFINWLAQAQSDFRKLGRETVPERLLERGTAIAGAREARRAAAPIRGQLSLATLIPRLFSVQRAAHRKPAPWPLVQQGWVSIKEATWTARGFSRPRRFRSDSAPLRKNASLVFRAETNIPLPYDVYWQVVNTGSEAATAGSLRGGFDAGTVERGRIVRRESTLYTGSHSIECYVVKDGFLVARSGPFIVNIE